MNKLYLLIGVLVFSSFYLSSQMKQFSGGNAITGNVVKLDSYNIPILDEPVLGDVDAPITLVAYEDFQCPFCRAFNTQLLPVLKKKYIDTGFVKLVYKDFPISSKHPFAFKAAIAGECAFRQSNEGFWKLHDYIYFNQASLSTQSLKSWAVSSGLDSEVFNNCYDKNLVKNEVKQDHEEGQSIRVLNTPTIFVNGFALKGLYPYEAYAKVIESEIERLGLR